LVRRKSIYNSKILRTPGNVRTSQRNDRPIKKQIIIDKHRLLIGALRAREQQILWFLIILGFALGGFIFLLTQLYLDCIDPAIFTIGTTGINLCLLAGIWYITALGYNYRYILLQLQKIEHKENLKSHVLKAWYDDFGENEIKKRFLFGYIPWCFPPEILAVFWWSSLGLIVVISLFSVSYLRIDSLNNALEFQHASIYAGLIIHTLILFILLAFIFPIWYGQKIISLINKEREK
jgi:hypothetical protein